MLICFVFAERTSLTALLKVLSPSKGVLSAATFAGFSIGNLVWGFVADRFGRKFAQLACTGFVIMFNLLICVVPNTYAIMVFRLLVSLSRGEFSICNLA